jgi:hypothetical protein
LSSFFLLYLFRKSIESAEGNFGATNDVVKQVNAECVDGANRGHELVSKLKENVAKLKTQQEHILKSVHEDLLGTKKHAQASCQGESFGSLALYGLIGAAVGFGVTWVSKREERAKLW